MSKQEHYCFIFLAIFCVAVSIGSIAFAVKLHDSSLGGLGGAIAVAISFMALFLRRDLTSTIDTSGHMFAQAIRADLDLKIRKKFANRKLMENVTGKPFVDAELLQLMQDRMSMTESNILNHLKNDASAQRYQNIYLTICSVCGTLSWGFGGIIVRHFTS